MAKITDPKDVKYLALEGGGGKGFAYLGAILALEELEILPINNAGDNYMDTLEEFGLLPIDPKKKRIIGISGASAGSITALMLAMGLTSSQIKKELSSPPGKFDAFFDLPEPSSHRKVTSSNEQDSYTDPLLMKNRNIVQPIFDKIINGAIKTIATIASLITAYKSVKIAAKLALRSSLSAPTIPKEEKIGSKKSDEQSNAIFDRVFRRGKRDKEDYEGKSFLLGLYLLNIIYDFGLFPGYMVRNYFTKLVDDYLKGDRSAGTTANQLSFKKFVAKTGIDLVVTGTNVTLHRPRLFSREFTPDFLVVEAVGISMNLPILFKPVYVDSSDPNYKGFWCDGGVLNNLPIHAFDKPHESLNPHTLALRLTEGKHPDYESLKPMLSITGIAHLFTETKNGKPVLNRFGRYMSDLLETFLYPAEEAKISPEVAEQSINLYTFDLSLTEFSPPINKQLLPVLFAHKSVYDYFGIKWNPESELLKILRLIDSKH